jgi:hypothetical protein
MGSRLFSVYAYNVRWNLERDLVDELAVADMYPTGSVHAEELESMYILSLAGSFSSRLLDLRSIGGTLRQIVPDGAHNLLVLLLALSLGNRSPSLLSLEIFNGSPIWVRTHVFLNLKMRMRRNRNVARIFFQPSNRRQG